MPGANCIDELSGVVDSLDEMTTTGASHVAELSGGEVRAFDVSPADAGLPEARPEDLKGGDAETNAAALTALLRGEAGPYRDVVLYNAAGALIVAGKVENLKDGVARGAAAVDEGRAAATLEKLVAITTSGTS